jgi:hypothetical protein
MWNNKYVFNQYLKNYLQGTYILKGNYTEFRLLSVFDSFMAAVRGLLAPMEIRPELAATVPERRPGGMTSLLFGPGGWQVGGTSAAIIVEVRPRPPWPAQLSGTSSMLEARSPMLIEKFCLPCPPC